MTLSMPSSNPLLGAALSLALGLLAARAARALEPQPALERSAVDAAEASAADAEEAEGEEEKPLAVDVAIRALTAYYDTGFLQERRGWVYQPEVEVSYRFVEDGCWEVRALAGAFASFHEYTTLVADPSGFPDHWYELTWWVGISLTLAELELRATFYRTTSPSDAFGAFEGFSLELAYDDEGWAPHFSLQPWASFDVETLGALDEVDRGIHLGLGLEPTWSLACTPLGEVALRFPVEGSFSLHDYYQEEDGTDHTFGFFSVGAFVDVPLGFLPTDPTLEAGITHYVFGSALEDYNGLDDDTVVSLGLTWSF